LVKSFQVNVVDESFLDSLAASFPFGISSQLQQMTTGHDAPGKKAEGPRVQRIFDTGRAVQALIIFVLVLGGLIYGAKRINPLKVPRAIEQFESGNTDGWQNRLIDLDDSLLR
jgi:hypothetical protein